MTSSSSSRICFWGFIFGAGLNWNLEESVIDAKQPSAIINKGCKKTQKEFVMKVVLEQNKRDSKEVKSQRHCRMSFKSIPGKYNNRVTYVFQFQLEIKFPPTRASTRQPTKGKFNTMKAKKENRTLKEWKV